LGVFKGPPTYLMEPDLVRKSDATTLRPRRHLVHELGVPLFDLLLLCQRMRLGIEHGLVGGCNAPLTQGNALGKRGHSSLDVHLGPWYIQQRGGTSQGCRAFRCE
jgi:hypothetical protein